MKEDLSPAHVRAASDALIDVITSSQYLAVAAEINALPEQEREAATFRLLTVEELRRRGLEIPEGLRISPRWFEPPEAGREAEGAEVLAHDAAALTDSWCTSVGIIACISHGVSN